MPDTATTPGPDILAATEHEVILRGQQFTAEPCGVHLPQLADLFGKPAGARGS